MKISKLWSFANKNDRIILIFGIISASITGMGLPSVVFLIGDAVDSFSPSSTARDSLEVNKTLLFTFIYIGLGIWVFGWGFYTLMILFSERVARRTRIGYLR